MPHLDHVVISVADLSGAAVRWARLGLPSTAGGRHPGGTANILIRGPRPAYVELITANEDADNHWAERVRSSHGPLSFAVAVDDLDAAREAAIGVGFAPGPIRDGARVTPTGQQVRWRLCDVGPRPFDPELPFLIEGDGGPYAADFESSRPGERVTGVVDGLEITTAPSVR